MLRVIMVLLALVVVQDEAYNKRYTEARERVDPWAEAVGERITALVPALGDGLAPWMPWDVEADHPPIGGCFFGCTAVVQVKKERDFVVAEPALVARVEAAEKQALDEAMKVAQGTPSAAALARVKQLEETVGALQRSARRGDVFIHVNGIAHQPRGAEKSGTRAGTIGGYPVYRFQFVDESYEPTPAGVRLAVLIGPEGFTNPKVDPSKMATEIKTIVVSAGVMSRRDTVKEDEALVRKLLERVDYVELGRMVKQP